MGKIKNIYEIDTPALLIEQSKLKANLQCFQTLADINGVKLRPHIKTHKIPELAELQISFGAKGIAFAKISEAEIMASAGINDIQVANIIVDDMKLKKLYKLNKRVEQLGCCADSIFGIEQMTKVFTDTDKKLNVYIKINTGFNRLGLTDYVEIRKLCDMINSAKGLNLKGILTHSGQIYAAKNLEEVRKTGLAEGELMVELAQKLKTDSCEIDEVSVGSTPSAKYCSTVSGVTELRAGNYIFFDIIQTALGSATFNDCALSIMSLVISVFHDRAIIDAGSKALALDLGAHGNILVNSFGRIVNKSGTIARLSEEHGIINFNNEEYKIGERIRIIPNHACAVMNLFDYVYIVDGEKIVEKLEIKARGKML